MHRCSAVQVPGVTSDVHGHVTYLVGGLGLDLVLLRGADGEEELGDVT